MLPQVQALLRGKGLRDGDEETLYFKGFVLGKKDQGINEGTDFEMFEIEKMTIYTSPEEIEISKLKTIISRMQDELDRLNKKKLHEDGRKVHKHLSKKEVLEIEKIFEDNPDIDINLIIDSYDSSRTIINNIKYHRHVKSSPKPIE